MAPPCRHGASTRTACAARTLRIAGLETSLTDALVRIAFADRSTWLQQLTPQQPAAIIPARQSGGAVVGTYLRLGVEHILLGVDHLLFVLACSSSDRNMAASEKR